MSAHERFLLAVRISKLYFIDFLAVLSILIIVMIFTLHIILIKLNYFMLHLCNNIKLAEIIWFENHFRLLKGYILCLEAIILSNLFNEVHWDEHVISNGIFPVIKRVIKAFMIVIIKLFHFIIDHYGCFRLFQFPCKSTFLKSGKSTSYLFHPHIF